MTTAKKCGPLSLYSLYDCSFQFIRKIDGTREIREGLPLATVETEGMGTQSVQKKGVLLVGLVGLVVPVQAIFALAALVGPIQNIFSLPYVQACWVACLLV